MRVCQLLNRAAGRIGSFFEIMSPRREARIHLVITAGRADAPPFPSASIYCTVNITPV